MPTENVIILGAGASASEGAPLQRDLFHEYYKARREGTLGMPATPGYKVPDDLIQFFKAAFGMNLKADFPDKTEQPTLEEVLGIIEIALQRSESFKRFGIMPSKPRLQRVREQLILLICAILSVHHSRTGSHGRMVSQIASAGWLATSALISLNYDIHMDNALIRARGQFGVDLDYGTEFANFDHGDDWTRPGPQSVPLFKLHGSLNWLYCPRCTALTLTPKEKGILSRTGRGLCGCKEELAPIIVPPSFFKEMSNYHLQTIWRKAEQALISAKRIVFCGYSMPDADIHIKYMLKRAELNRTGPAAQVFVVNDHNGKKEGDRSAEIARFRRLFRDSVKVRFKKLSFQDFCEQGPGCLTTAEDYDPLDPV
jgi:NAD-dependent SIR2 family protein deacetylase